MQYRVEIFNNGVWREYGPVFVMLAQAQAFCFELGAVKRPRIVEVSTMRLVR